ATSTPAPAATTSKDATMDNLIALFREQAAVLAAYGRGALPATAPVDGSLEVAPKADVTGIVRSEIARISGFPEKALRTTQTIAGDLGFDSIMVTDLFGGLTRKIPGVKLDPAGFGPATTIADVIAMTGGRVGEPSASEAATTAEVTPQSRIGQFEEVK